MDREEDWDGRKILSKDVGILKEERKKIVVRVKGTAGPPGMKDQIDGPNHLSHSSATDKDREISL